MDTMTTVLLVGGTFVLIMFVVLFYSVRLQRKAVGTQDSGMSKIDQSLALQRESIQLQKEALALVQDSVALQKEANRLLAGSRNRGHYG